jgi:hypothetical protein
MLSGQGSGVVTFHRRQFEPYGWSKKTARYPASMAINRGKF